MEIALIELTAKAYKTIVPTAQRLCTLGVNT